jgi:hypothetical protein
MSIQQNFSNTKPSLSLNFARSKQLDSRVSFIRSSSATYIDDNGLIVTAPVDSPRFDHDPATGDCLGLLIEESRTNLLSNSTSTAAWTTGTFTTETTYPIFGLNTVRITDLSSDGDSPRLSGAALSAGTYTVSHYIDTINSTCTDFQIFLFATTVNGNNSIRSFFDLSTKTFVGFNYSGSDWSNPSTNVVNCGNGIYRLSITGTLALSASLSRAYVSPSPTDTSYAIVAGSQLESGAFATSFIPTSGSTVTRSADNASITGTNFSSWFNPAESTIITNSNFVYADSTLSPTLFTISDGTTTNRLQQFAFSTSQLANRIIINSNNYLPSNSSGLTIIGKPVKTALSYASGTDLGAAVVNGGSANLSSPSGILTAANQMEIGGYPGGLYKHSGTISQLTYYPKRLTNNQLQNLTK